MEVFKVFWFVILEIFLVHYTHIIRCTDDLDNWRKHEKRIREFPCGIPQPRSLKLEDLVEENQLPDIHSEVFPKMTVLHRCDSQSGCCKSASKACTPQVVQNVSLTFRIIRRINTREAVHHHHIQRDRFLHVETTNHTFCSCQAAYDLPK